MVSLLVPAAPSSASFRPPRALLGVLLLGAAACSQAPSGAADPRPSGDELAADASDDATKPPASPAAAARPSTDIRSLDAVCDGSSAIRFAAQQRRLGLAGPTDDLGEQAVFLDGHCKAWVVTEAGYFAGELTAPQRASLETSLRLADWGTWGGGVWNLGCCDGDSARVALPGFTMTVGYLGGSGAVVAPEGLEGVPALVRQVARTLAGELPAMPLGRVRARVFGATYPGAPANDTPVAWPLAGSLAGRSGAPSYLLEGADATAVGTLFSATKPAFFGRVTAEGETHFVYARPAFPFEPVVLDGVFARLPL